MAPARVRLAFVKQVGVAAIVQFARTTTLDQRALGAFQGERGRTASSVSHFSKHLLAQNVYRITQVLTALLAWHPSLAKVAKNACLC